MVMTTVNVYTVRKSHVKNTLLYRALVNQAASMFDMARIVYWNSVMPQPSSINVPEMVRKG